MMNKFRLLLLASSLFVLNGIGHAQTSTMSLNSSNPKIVWEVKPQADLNNIGGEQISTPGFKMPDYVKGVVPGAVLQHMLKPESFPILITLIIYIK